MARIRAGFLIKNERRLSIAVFGLFYGWLMAVPFEGQILYEMAKLYQIQVNTTMYLSLGAHVLGLIISGFFVKEMRFARPLMFGSISLCLVSSGILCLPPSYWWSAILFATMFVSGMYAAAWGFYFKDSTAPSDRNKTAAQVIVFSNAVMLVLNIVAVHISPYAALGLGACLLFFVLRLARFLPKTEKENDKQEDKPRPDWFSQTLVFLCLFVMIASIEGGIMYQAINPFYGSLLPLTCCYSMIPYIVAVLIVKDMLGRVIHCLLYIAIAMGGFGLIAFWHMPYDALGYLIVDTLLMGAAGIVHLFLWSTLGIMLSYTKRPALIFGIGLAANDIGLMLGGVYGHMIIGSDGFIQQMHLLSLTVIFAGLILLALLQIRLFRMTRATGLYRGPSNASETNKKKEPFADALTAREYEVMKLLLKGYTYKAAAGELSISENTVKTYVKNIYSKFEVQSRTELIRYVNDASDNGV